MGDITGDVVMTGPVDTVIGWSPRVLFAEYLGPVAPDAESFSCQLFEFLPPSPVGTAQASRTVTVLPLRRSTMGIFSMIPSWL